MKKAIAAAAIIAATIVGASAGITASATAQAMQANTRTAKTELVKSYTLNDVNLWMGTGYIETVNHTPDFTGDFTIRSDIGKIYRVQWDPEDFSEGDRIIFTAYNFYSETPLGSINPENNKIIRVHAY